MERATETQQIFDDRPRVLLGWSGAPLNNIWLWSLLSVVPAADRQDLPEVESDLPVQVPHVQSVTGGAILAPNSLD